MKLMRWVLVLFTLWLALQAGVPVTVKAAPFAYITNVDSNTVSVIDTATNAVTATVPVGASPAGVAVHPAGTRVYVTNFESSTVSVIDTGTNTVLTTVPVGVYPFGVAVHPAGTRVYVANGAGFSLSVVDASTNTVVATVPLPDAGPFGLAVHPDGTRVYVADVAWNRVLALDTGTNTIVATIPVGAGPTGVVVHPNGTRVYVANYSDNTVSVIATASNTVVATVPVGSGPGGIAVHPAGTRVYVANDIGSLSVLDTATNTVIATVPVETPQGVAVHPDGTRVYVANYYANTVSVVATASNTIIATVPVGSGPVAFGQFIGPDLRDSVGTFRPTDGAFYLDYNANGAWDGCSVDRCLSVGLSGDVALVGDWNGSGTAKVGTFRPADGAFYLDYNGNGQWDGCGVDRCLSIGLNGDIPLVGDWNGSGTAKVGTFRPSDGAFYLDYNGNGVWDGCDIDRCLQIGLNGDVPLVGDWNGSGTAKVGTFRPTDGAFYLDYNGNGVWDGCGTDRCLGIGLNGDIPLVGDWNGSGTAKVGTFRPTDGAFYLDYNGNGQWDGCGVDRCLSIGLTGDIPFVGDWNGSGTAKVGTFRPTDGAFYLDYNGNGQWDGCGVDRCLSMGLNGDIPLVGKW